MAPKWLLDYVSPVIPPVVITPPRGGDDRPRVEIWDTRKGKKKLKEIKEFVIDEFEELTGKIPAQASVNKVVNEFKHNTDLDAINAELSILKAQLKQLIQDEQDEEDVMMLMMGFI